LGLRVFSEVRFGRTGGCADYAGCAKVNVSPKTYERYAAIVRTHLKPARGALQLTKLTPVRVADNPLGDTSLNTAPSHRSNRVRATRTTMPFSLLALVPGTRIGVYVTTQIGAGGMGEAGKLTSGGL